MSHYITQAERKKIRNDMSIWMANALLKQDSDKLTAYEKDVCKRVIKKKWGSQYEHDVLQSAEKRCNPFDDEGVAVDD